MKYMKLGTRPDTFYTEEATRSISLEVPSDLTIQIGNTKYLIHKFPILPKCGLLQQLCSDSGDYSAQLPIELHDIPGGEKAFEICAKFCYGIAITLSAHNFVLARCASQFLRMTEETEKGNLIQKLDGFFYSCILHGWRDSTLVLQMTKELPVWSENLEITSRCIDAIIEKILAQSSKVTWSFTYTRPGYAGKPHRSVPKDWWTEDISDLDVDLFRRLISALQSTNSLPPPLIGEALHVYAARWLPGKHIPVAGNSQTQAGEITVKQRRILENIVTMIPANRDSVSGRFLFRLLKVANFLGSLPSIKAELMRKAGQKLDEATVNDLLIPSHSVSNSGFYDVDLVRTLIDNFLARFRGGDMLESGNRRGVFLGAGETESSRSRRLKVKVGKLIDGYLAVVAGDVNFPAEKFVTLAEALPESCRPEHDDLYRAIDVYLKLHPEISKTDKKRLCRVLDCTKLTANARIHAVRNERLPLRLVVQLLFLEQDRATHSLEEQAGRRNRAKPVTRGEGVANKLSTQESREKVVEPVRGDVQKTVEKIDRGDRKMVESMSGDRQKSSKFSGRGGHNEKVDEKPQEIRRRVAKKKVVKQAGT